MSSSDIFMSNCWFYILEWKYSEKQLKRNILNGYFLSQYTKECVAGKLQWTSVLFWFIENFKNFCHINSICYFAPENKQIFSFLMYQYQCCILNYLQLLKTMMVLLKYPKVGINKKKTLLPIDVIDEEIFIFVNFKIF